MSRLSGRARDAAGAFADAYGEEPVAVWSAPGRVNLIGEHTDYNGGLCLPLALDFRADCAFRVTDDGVLRIRSAQRPGELVEVAMEALTPGAVDGWAAYVAGAVWRSAPHAPGVQILVDSDLPEGAGLSSSAALAVATVAAVGGERGAALARAAQAAENEFVGVPCGLMDQTVSAMAQPGHALVFDARTGHATHVPLDLGAWVLLVIDTCAPHQLNDGGYARRRRECDEAARQLGVVCLSDAVRYELLPSPLRARTRHVVTENARVRDAVEALRAADAPSLGQLLTASHASLRDDFEVTVPALDVTVETCLAAGAAGARMTGGGFGGSVIALVEEPEQVAREVERAFARLVQLSMQRPTVHLGVVARGQSELRALEAIGFSPTRAAEVFRILVTQLLAHLAAAAALAGRPETAVLAADTQLGAAQRHLDELGEERLYLSAVRTLVAGLEAELHAATPPRRARSAR